jgi:sigma-E factor negative regulatory protein RseC
MGRISEVKGNTITVHAGEIAACFGCMNQECKSNRRIISAENLNHFNLSPGQFVEIETSVKGAFIQFLQATLPPLIGFTAAYFFARICFPASSVAIRVAIGIIGFFLAGFGFYLYRKKFPAKNNPQVVRILDEGKMNNQHC